MPEKKFHQFRINLVAAAILATVTLFVGVTVFVVMANHSEKLLSSGLQNSLQNRIELTQTEVQAAYDKSVVVATRPFLILQVEKANAGKDMPVVLEALKKAASSFLKTGFSALAIYDKNGKLIALDGKFASTNALAVQLAFAGDAKLLAESPFVLHVQVDMKRDGRVVGKLVTEAALPITSNAFNEANRLGKTGEMAMCAPAGSNMQCFPTTLYPRVLTLPQRTSKGELLPMGYALAGKTGFIITQDYRKQEVVAAYAPVANYGLGMVLKLDSAELYAPVWQQLRYLVPLLFGLLVVALLLLRWLLSPLVARLVSSETETAQRSIELTQEIAQHRLAASETLRFKNILDNTLDMVFMFEPTTLRFVYLNQGALLRGGFELEEWLGMTPYDVTPDMTETVFRKQISPLLSGELSSMYFESMQRHKDGSKFPVDILLQLIRERDGNNVFVAIVRDITERKKTETALLMESKKNEALLQAAGDGIHVLDLNGRVLQVNDAFARMLGYKTQEMTGMDVTNWDANWRPSPEEMQKRMLELMESSETFETQHKHRNGSIIEVEISVVGVVIDEQKMLFCAARDITEKKKSSELIWQQANFDSLTGLPNRRMFYNRLEQEIKSAQRSGLPMALLLLDLDRFKEVNDNLGHAQGDLLLIEASTRISECIRNSDTVARLGGDEFTVILPELKDVNSVGRIAQKIIESLAAPFELQQESVFISASIGIAMYPDDAVDIDILIKSADQAMYLAKNSGRGCFSYFTAALQESAQNRLRLLGDLRLALGAKQLAVHYQPIVDMASGKIVKAEALLRWHHPQRGMVSPDQFIPLAEESGLIHEIGDWVFHEVARELLSWRTEYLHEFQISVNMSPLQLRQKMDGTELSWVSHLNSLNLPGQNISIEITEGLLLKAEGSVTERLLAFRDAGIQVAIDDFGTGYSSLAYLKKFDIDYLKIDQSFVSNLGSDPDDQVLCEAIIIMAHKLGLKLIAEGVETEQQRDLLASYGCDYAQGWLYSKALPSTEFEALMREQEKF
jgi:diguanylate cyclase (GGDEF)-like protein/PAS domain S-box-containing protein